MLEWIYLIPAGWLIVRRLRKQAKLNERNLRIEMEELEAGLTEAASLHPKIDPSLCLGCGTCVTACPEKDVLGIVYGKAKLIKPTHCIGHGVCAEACPLDAIELVFGSAKRGVDIPLLQQFETSQPGVFVAGELGGMGLIRNAVKQGAEAMDIISASLGRNLPDVPDMVAPPPPNMMVFDVLIVGAGPAGLAAALAAKAKGLNYVVVEQEDVGGAIAHYPKGKVVMTAPAELPLAGTMPFTIVSKEELMEYIRGVVREHQLRIEFGHKVEHMARAGQVFQIKTNKVQVYAKRVMLAIGRRGTPRKLGVAGEELPKVVYRMVDPDQYKGQQVVVVGGGDSALEAAASIAELGGQTKVILSYRGDAFGRAKTLNRERVQLCAKKGSLEILFKSTLSKIEPQHVILKTEAGEREVPNDAVIVCAGGELPTQFLQQIGVQVETKYGTA